MGPTHAEQSTPGHQGGVAPTAAGDWQARTPGVGIYLGLWAGRQPQASITHTVRILQVQ